MIGWDVGKQPDHKRTDELCKDGQQATLFSHLHEPEKKGHHPDKPQREFYGTGSRVDHGL